MLLPKVWRFVFLLFPLVNLFCGIEYDFAKMILEEHKYRPITGTVLTIGRQTVHLTLDQAKDMLQREGISIRQDALIAIDHETLGSGGRQFLTDRSFFSLFSDARVIALDISSYEGAELIADLNQPIDDQYANIADFIFNGSCLDNLFDTAMALRNMSRMAKVGCRIMNVEHGSPVHGAYIMFSPHYFFDYYALNKFSDIRIYTFLFDNFSDPWHVFLWEPYFLNHDKWYFSDPMNNNWRHILVMVISEKTSDSTFEKSPVQGGYRQCHSTDLDVYLQAFLSSRESKRPLPSVPPYKVNITPILGHTYLGRIR